MSDALMGDLLRPGVLIVIMGLVIGALLRPRADADLVPGGLALTILTGLLASAAVLPNAFLLGLPFDPKWGLFALAAAVGFGRRRFGRDAVHATRRQVGSAHAPGAHAADGQDAGARGPVTSAPPPRASAGRLSAVLTFVAVAIALASPAMVTATAPPMAYDALSTWWPKVVEAATGAETQHVTTALDHLHAEYPRGFAWIVKLGSVGAKPDPRLLKLATLLFTALAALVVAGRLRAAGAAVAAVLAALLFVLVPDVARWSHSGYADLPLAAAVLVTGLGLGARGRQRADGVLLAVVGAIGAASIKQEGAVLLLVVAGTLLWRAARAQTPVAWRELLLALLGMSLVLPTWWQRSSGPAEVLGALERVLSEPTLLIARLDAVATTLGQALLDPSALRDSGTTAPFVWAAWVALPCALILLPRGPRLGSMLPAVALALASLIVFAVTPHDLRWHVRTAFPRLVLQLLPLLVLGAAGRLAGVSRDSTDAKDGAPSNAADDTGTAPTPPGSANASTRNASTGLLLACLLPCLTLPGCGDSDAGGTGRIPGDEPTQAPATTERPNVLLILADDLGYGDLGCYGNGEADTPRIDALAAQGARLTDFHTTAPVCAPSRLSIFSGRYHQRGGGLVGNDASSIDQVAYEREMSALLPRLLQQSGYVTGLMGKWHLGPAGALAPTQRGFDEFRGFLSGSIDYVSHVNQRGVADWWHGTARADVEGYATHLVTDDAIDFIEHNAANPFFLCVSHPAPHKPHQGPDDQPVFVRGQSNDWRRDTEAGKYAEVVRELDTGVGRLLDALERLALSERTLVLFVSDNGATREGSNAPLRGDKGSLLEGGHRVPAIARWPGRIPAGTEVADLTSAVDLLPTVLAAAGSPAPGELPSDGLDLLPRLLDGTAVPARTLFWDYVDGKGQRQQAVRRGPWKLLFQGDEVSFYNATFDPGEQRELSDVHGERIQPLGNALARWLADVGTELDPADR